jgi:small subunit ribosomal protein S16
MSIKIRLSRVGRKKVPFYHVIVAQTTSPRDGKFIEQLGVYDPLSKDDNKSLKINSERVKYWIGVGAQPTERVALLLNKIGIKEAEKFKPTFIPKEKKLKSQNPNSFLK